MAGQHKHHDGKLDHHDQLETDRMKQILDKDFERYVEVLAIPVAGLAVGRGLAARKPG